MIGPDRDIPAPDVNTDAERDGLADGHDLDGERRGHDGRRDGQAARRSAAAVAMSEPPRRECSSAHGRHSRSSDLPMTGARAVIQGHGKVGGPLVYMLSSAGMRVIAVTDAGGGVYNPAGLDAAGLARHVDATGSVAGFERADPLEPERIWELECELAVPAALAGVITAEVAEKMGAQLIVEAANGPTLARGGPDPRAAQHRRDPGHPRQRRWRDGLLLRVGPEPPGLCLGGRPRRRAPPTGDVDGLRRCVAPVARAEGDPPARRGGGAPRSVWRGDRAEGPVPLVTTDFVATRQAAACRPGRADWSMDHSHPAPEGSRAGPLPEPPESRGCPRVWWRRRSERSGRGVGSALRIDLTPLRSSREFRLLFIGQGVSFFGSMVTYVALPYQAYRISHSSLIVGLLSLTELIPLLITAFVGGALADSVDRRRMVRITESAMCLTIGALVVNSASGRLGSGCSSPWRSPRPGIDGLQRPSLDAMVPRLVPADELPAASALSSLKGNLGMVAGPPVAGVLIVAVGLPATYGVDVATFFVSLVALALMRAVPPPPDSEGSRFRAVAEGLRYARSRQDLLGSYLVDMNAMFFGIPTALFPQVASHLGGAAVLGVSVRGTVGRLAARDRDERVGPPAFVATAALWRSPRLCGGSGSSDSVSLARFP